MSGRLALGIDLGTTFSKAAFLDDNASTQMVRKIPSVVYVSGNEVCVGTVAWNRGNSENTSGQLIRLTKRHLARPDMALPQTSGRYTAVELTSLILGELKSATERLLNRKIHEAVLSVPVSFGDVERRAVEDAARLCNLNVLDLIEEPVAVALKFWTED